MVISEINTIIRELYCICRSRWLTTARLLFTQGEAEVATHHLIDIDTINYFIATTQGGSAVSTVSTHKPITGSTPTKTSSRNRRVATPGSATYSTSTYSTIISTLTRSTRPALIIAVARRLERRALPARNGDASITNHGAVAIAAPNLQYLQHQY